MNICMIHWWTNGLTAHAHFSKHSNPTVIIICPQFYVYFKWIFIYSLQHNSWMYFHILLLNGDLRASWNSRFQIFIVWLSTATDILPGIKYTCLPLNTEMHDCFSLSGFKKIKHFCLTFVLYLISLRMSRNIFSETQGKSVCA